MAEEVLYSPERIAYVEEKPRQAMILTAENFVLLSRRYLSMIPLAGAAAFRLKNGTEGILINWDHYAHGLGEDFSDCVDFEVEHEAQELWLTRGKEKVDAFGPDHYEAILCALRLAKKAGKLDRYLELKTKQLKTFEAAGDIKAMEELEFYKQEAIKLSI